MIFYFNFLNPRVARKIGKRSKKIAAPVLCTVNCYSHYQLSKFSNYSSAEGLFPILILYFHTQLSFVSQAMTVLLLFPVLPRGQFFKATIEKKMPSQES
jgi:hypothetical protein